MLRSSVETRVTCTLAIVHSGWKAGTWYFPGLTAAYLSSGVLAMWVFVWPVLWVCFTSTFAEALFFPVAQSFSSREACSGLVCLSSL